MTALVTLWHWRKPMAFLLAFVSVYAWHRAQISAAVKQERVRATMAAQVEAGKRIKQLEQSNEAFRSLSARDRCRAFMRDSGLPDTHCD